MSAKQTKGAGPEGLAERSEAGGSIAMQITIAARQ